MFSDDPVMDAHRHDMEQEKMLARLPVCERCKKPIQDDEYFDIYGEVLCEKCVRAKFAFQIEI
jgi:ribosomal protein L34E